MIAALFRLEKVLIEPIGIRGYPQSKPLLSNSLMDAALKSKFITVEQYLSTENDNPSGIRHEYVNGLVYAMAGASRGHNRVTNKLALR